MAFLDDFGIDYTNKRIYHVSGTTVYDVNAMYSTLMDTFDELVQMDDPVPMSAQTPTEYTMINEWFLDEGAGSEAHKYLKNGAIKTVGYDGKIQVLTLLTSGYVNCIAGDIGKMVTDDGGNTGKLLGYLNTIRKWWVRWATTIADASVMLIADAIDKCWSYNANTAVYTDETADINEATANDVVLPPIQITTVGDAAFFGSSGKFGRLRVNVGTAKAVTGGVFAWQYWNGAWTALSGLTDGTNFFGTVGTNNVTFTVPADWVTNAVNGVTQYWIRAVVTTLPTVITTAPLGTQAWEGAGAGTASGASVTGEDLFANVYTLGTIESVPAPQIYIFQAGSRIAEWSNLTNWDRGQIDVLIKVKEAGTEIAGAVITVFARQSGDLYDNYEIDLTAGGRNAVPLGTSDDLNEDSGEFYLLYDAETVGFTTLGQIITGGTSTAKAELVAVTDWGTTGVLKLRDKQGTFQDNETITGSTEGSATVNGTVGDTYVTYDAEGGTPPGVGTTMVGGTSASKRILRGIQDDGTTGKLVLQVDTTQTGANRNPYYKAFQDNEQIQESGTPANYYYSSIASTTIVSGFDDITVAFVNGTITYSATSGALTPGEKVTQAVSGATAIFLYQTTITGAGTATLGNVVGTFNNTNVVTGAISAKTFTSSGTLTSAHTINKNFEQQSAYPYDVIVQAGSIYQAGRTLAQVYEYFKYVCQAGSGFDMYTVVSGVITILDGEEYIIAYTGYTPSKAAPFATFAGGKLFGAQGIWVEGMAAGQSYTFKDSNGALRDPYASIIISITNTLSGDRISVFRTLAGVIKKDLYTKTTQAVNQTTIVVNEAIATDTPASGVIRIVDVSESTEHRYRYASWSGSTFTLVTDAGDGTVTTAGSPGATQLIDSVGAFGGADTVKVGDVIYNQTDSSWAHVTVIVSTTELTTTRLQGGGDNEWDLSDQYYILRTPVAYTTSDTAYPPFIDAQATTTSIEQSVLYSADRTVLIRARRKAAIAILPFETSASVTSAGLAVAVIRTTDAIVT